MFRNRVGATGLNNGLDHPEVDSVSALACPQHNLRRNETALTSATSTISSGSSAPGVSAKVVFSVSLGQARSIPPPMFR